MIWTNHLSPWIFRFSFFGHPWGIRWYGTAYGLGFILGYLAFRNALLKKELVGKTDKILDRLFAAIILGVVVGGRMGFVVQNLGEWAKDPLFPLKVYQGGMAFFGGLVGVILGMYWVAKKEDVRMLQLTDIAAAPAFLGLAIGRLANFANAELPGKITNGKWGVIYPNFGPEPRYPSELFESASHFFAFAVILYIGLRIAKGPGARHGIRSAWFLILYGLLRFITDFWRAETPIGPGHVLNNGQWASLVVLIIGIGLLVGVMRKPEQKETGEELATDRESGVMN